MYLYTIIEAVVGVLAGILIAVCTKKADHVTYNQLDRVGRITNIVLIPVYICLAPLSIFFGMISSPRLDGALEILGWIVSIIIASGAMFCGLGLGASVALRKKGKSKLSFGVQFAGAIGIGLSVLLYIVFAGNLLKYLN